MQFVLDPPLYTEVLPAIRAVNTSRPADQKLRVLLGDPPIDWAQVKTPADHRRWIEQREVFPADLIRREVLARKRRALLVFGQMHFQRKNFGQMHLQRKNAVANFTSEGPAASVVSLLEDGGHTRVFTTWWARPVRTTAGGDGKVARAEPRGRSGDFARSSPGDLRRPPIRDSRRTA